MLNHKQRKLKNITICTVNSHNIEKDIKDNRDNIAQTTDCSIIKYNKTRSSILFMTA